ncbi:CpaD family pilus assembly lipoprotein [Burkholderia guangdongensis]|uniref:CpaD family pilus assembly lipoprotein n=1 Tax=Burkholderia guangdongensis TaxID=1792500 RepID=UPI0015CBE845|nr:CpaD family pilus assembly lipoprotein [Burkholderia guangdongensis]
MKQVMLIAPVVVLGGCMSAPPPLGMPDVSAIGYDTRDGGRAIPPDCAQLNQRSHLVDAGFARPGVAFGCATYTNLATMLARPEDIVAPLPYAGADASRAADAVRRYEEGRTTPLSAPSTTSSVSH